MPRPEPLKDCDLVLKGGVASGLVYARMLLRLKDHYRFLGVAGASAGGIAATFAAAAEYSRMSGDEAGFDRLEAWAEAMPVRLRELFQASPPFRALLKATIALAPGSGKANYAMAAACFAPTVLIGAGAVMAMTAGIYALIGLQAWGLAMPALVLAAILGGLGGFVAHWVQVVILAATRYNFGICSGLSQRGAQGGAPAITDWMHAATQDIAGQTRPLTFGDLDARGIDLRLISSNVSLARPFALPDFEHAIWFDPAAWQRLFPADVMTALQVTQPDQTAVLWRMPDAQHLPVLVALRMSIACPGLLEQVPVYLSPQRDPSRRLYFSDGGLSQNFPFDVFAQNPPRRPGLAVDLDTLPEWRPEDAANDGTKTSRIWTLADEVTRGEATFTRLPGPLAFCWAVFKNMREGQNRAAIRQVHPAVEIFRIGLKRTEGGMNLDMSSAQIQAMMAHGDAAGAFIVKHREGT